MKRILSVLTAFLCFFTLSAVCFFSQSVFSAETDKMSILRMEFNSAEDSEKQVLTIEGKVLADGEKLTVFLLNPGKTDTDLAEASALSMTDVVNYIWQPQVAQDGSFEFAFQMKGDKGYYTLVAVADGWDGWYVHPEKIWYSTAEDLRNAVDAVNAVAEGDADTLESVLFDAAAGSESNAVVLGFYTTTYDALPSGKKDDALKYAMNYILAQRSTLTDDKFTSAEQIKNVFAGGIALYCFNNELIDKEELIENKQNMLMVAEHISWDLYIEKLTDAQRTSLLDDMAEYTSVDLLKKDFIEKLCVFGVKNLAHGDISDVFRACADVLDDMELDEYFGLSSTADIDKAIVGKTYTINKLCSAVNELLSSDDGGKKGGSSGGSGGKTSSSGGATSFTYDTDASAGTPVLPSQQQQSFTDMSDAQWAAEAVNALVRAGIINGRGEGLFAPNDTVTREEFTKMLVLTLGIALGGEAEFSDVPADSWYAPYVAAAYSNGVVKGIGENLFGTGMQITRQDMATMIYNGVKTIGISLEQDTEKVFADDGQIAHYAKEGVYALSASGIINGMGENTFAPAQAATRAQAAKILYEVFKLISTQKGV